MTFIHQRTTGLSGAGGSLGENQYASLSAINDAISAEEISEGEIVVAGDTGIAYIVGLNGVATKAMCGDVVYPLLSNGQIRNLSSIRHSTTDYDTSIFDEVSGTVTY